MEDLVGRAEKSFREGMTISILRVKVKELEACLAEVTHKLSVRGKILERELDMAKIAEEKLEKHRKVLEQFSEAYSAMNDDCRTYRLDEAYAGYLQLKKKYGSE